MTEEDRLVRGCFAAGEAEFAQHTSDMERAADFLKYCIVHNKSWDDVRKLLSAHLDKQVPLQNQKPELKEYVRDQMARAQMMFAPWLDDIDIDEKSGGNVTRLHD